MLVKLVQEICRWKIVLYVHLKTNENWKFYFEVLTFLQDILKYIKLMNCPVLKRMIYEAAGKKQKTHSRDGL